MEQLREPRFYPDRATLPICTNDVTEKTLQSIDNTLKRIEESLSELSSLKIDYAKLANSINLRSVQLDQSLLGRRIQSST